MRTIEEIAVSISAASGIGDTASLQTLADEAAAIGTREATAISYRTRGRVLQILGEYHKALGQLHDALDLFLQIDAADEIARTRGLIGVVCISNGDFAPALENLSQALEHHEKTGSRRDIAVTLDQLGRVYMSLGDFPRAIDLFSRSMEIHVDLDHRLDVANAIANIGSAYYYISDYPHALENFRKALDQFDKIGNRTNAAKVTGNIGNAYWSSGDVEQAMDYYHRALAIHEELGNRDGVAHVSSRIGNIYEHRGEDEMALEHFQQSLNIYREVGNPVGICREMGMVATSMLRLRRFEEAAMVLDDQSKLSIVEPAVQAQYHENRAALDQHNNALDDALQHMTSALAITEEAGLKSNAASCHKRLRDLAGLRRDLDAYIHHNDAYQRIREEISGMENMRKIATMDAQHKIDAERNEKERHLSLLYNTLPPSIADRVLKGERVNDKYESVVVLFVDLAGFTRMSSMMDPDDVVALLETIFTKCDDIIETYGLTKIKTIGDAYMAVCFPDGTDIALRTAEAALHMSRDLSNITGPDGLPVVARIGAHIGPVIAGIIGTARMQYDVWGDTVNVASRMESTSEPGRIHVSEALATALNGSTTVALTLRGDTEVKGKGTMQTYWLE